MSSNTFKMIINLKNGKQLHTLGNSEALPYQVNDLNTDSLRDAFIQMGNCFVKPKDIDNVEMINIVYEELEKLSEKV